MKLQVVFFLVSNLFLICVVPILPNGYIAAAQAQTSVLLEDFEAPEGMRQGPSGNIDLWILSTSLNPNQSIAVEDHDGSRRLRVTATARGRDEPVGPTAALRYMFYPNTGIGGNRYPYPQGFTRHWIKSGTFSPTINRLEFWMKCDQDIPFNDRGNLNLGTYVKQFNTDVDPDTQGSHWYNFISGRFYANQWNKIVMFWSPQANNFSSGSTEYVADPTFNGPFAINPPEHYWNGLTRFYIDVPADGTGIVYPITCWNDDFKFIEDSFKPNEYIKNVSITYNGTEYVLGFGGKKGSVRESYELRYSSVSMKVNGWSSGTVFGGTVQSNGNAFTQVERKTPPLPKAANTMYFGIKAASHNDFVEIEFPPYGLDAPPPDNLAPRPPMNLRI